jgi:carbon monoxide dehydrogenase subunit G
MSLIGWRIERAATSPTVEGCRSEEVEFMTGATVKRVFEVDAPLEEAWQRLAEVERWPEWAPHIPSVTVSPPGVLGPTSSGALQIKRLGRNTFRMSVRMSVWEPPVRWEWVGGLPGVRICYDHRFESSGPAVTRLEWLVELHGAWRRSFDLSSPECTVAISTGRSPDCRSGFRR